MMADAERSGDRIKRIAKTAIPAIVGAIFVAALYFLYTSLREIHYHDVAARLRSYSPSILLIALAATAANYLVLTLYDVLALRYAGKSLPYGRVAFTSFLSYVFSYNVGLSIFGSGAIRTRFYSSWGMDTASIARVVAFCAVTFWLGLATMGGMALAASPPAFLSGWRFAGLVPLAVVAAYLFASFRNGKGIRFGEFSIRLPKGSMALAQVLVASIDWTFAAFVLYILLPPGAPPFPSFIAIYVIAQFAGASSHIPGGVGVFESVLFASLSSSTPSDALIGALIAYRGIYYLVPLAVAIVSFVSREAWVARHTIARVASGASRLFASFVPSVLSITMMFSGAVLLISGAVPAAIGRLEVIEPFIPLPLLELSHFMASLAGLAMLVVADGIRRRIDAAYWFSLGLLVTGAAFSLLKGLDWEEALVMAASAALIIPSRNLFARRAALLSRSASRWSLAVMGVVVTTSLCLTVFANKHALYSSETWLLFELSRDAPRSLRAGVGVAVAAAMLGLRAVLAPSPRLPRETLSDAGADARRVLGTSTRSTANLVLLGDKYLRFSHSKASFLMYGLEGRTFVVMGEPVGDTSEFPSLVWDFFEDVRRQGGRVVWYEVGAGMLPLLAELGFRFFKIGEEAVVDLTSFSLEGGQAKRLRPPRNKMLREGFTFSVLPAAGVSARMSELRAVSNAWLELKDGREKGFSLGFFDEDYLSNFPCAIVEREGRIVAFSNIWPSGDGKDLSIDLMRHSADAPNGTMEYLFIELLSWGAAKNYASFNLGMAPMSGVESREAAPLWNKAISLIFHKGEGIYNFQGLRAFKDKFGPEWSPRYIATANGVSLPFVAADIALIVSRGRRLPDA